LQSRIVDHTLNCPVSTFAYAAMLSRKKVVCRNCEFFTVVVSQLEIVVA